MKYKIYIGYVTLLLILMGFTYFNLPIDNTAHTIVKDKNSSIVTPKIKIVKKIVYRDKIVYKNNKDVISCITLSDLNNDLKNTSLSSKNRKLLLSSIQEASKKYNIPVMILYALIYSESSFRFWIRHSLSTITLNKRKIKVRAIGLGGIIYEIWGKELKEAGIIETKTDLFQIRSNVLSTAYVLHKLSAEPLLKGTNNPYISGMRRYYGGNVKGYTIRIKRKMSSLMYKKVFNSYEKDKNEK